MRKTNLEKELFEENPKISIEEMEKEVELHHEKCLAELERMGKGIISLNAIAELKLRTRAIF